MVFFPRRRPCAVGVIAGRLLLFRLGTKLVAERTAALVDRLPFYRRRVPGVASDSGAVNRRRRYALLRVVGWHPGP